MEKEAKEKTVNKTADKEKVSKVTKDTAKETKSSNQSIIIAVLATALVCIVLVIVVLALTGVLRIGKNDSGETSNTSTTTTVNSGDSTEPTEEPKDDSPSTAGVTPGGVTCYNDTRVQAGKLEFCLPKHFGYGEAGGEVSSYILEDDEGWAEVKVYVKQTQQSPTQFITNLSPNLKVTNQNYKVNDVTWVRAEAGDYMLALATKHDGYIYAIFYSIKLDSDSTTKAWDMILETPVFPN